MSVISARSGVRVKPDADESSGAVKSANRVLDLFELLARTTEMSHADIAEQLSIPKSSLTQLLRTLIARDYVEYAPASKGYKLGKAFARLSQRTGEARDIVSIAQPVLEEMTRLTNETSALNQLRGTMAEVVATVPSPQRLLSNMHRGDMAPLYTTSGGKAILAHLPDAIRDEYLANVVLEPVTAKTLRSRRELKKQIAEVRRTGIAYSYEEFTPGIIGLGVPILSSTGHPVASLNVAIPALRFNPRVRDHAVNVLRQAAERIHRQLGDRLDGSAESRRSDALICADPNGGNR